MFYAEDYLLLEMKLRQNHIAVISDVKWATLEPNGQVGYELKEEAQSGRGSCISFLYSPTILASFIISSIKVIPCSDDELQAFRIEKSHYN